MNSEALKQYIRKHSSLFWDVREEAKENLSLNAVVETMLKYGHISDIRELFDLVGIRRISEIFHEQTSRNRMNYPRRTVHFFSQYFARHAS
jgi:hypothetical protein